MVDTLGGLWTDSELCFIKGSVSSLYSCNNVSILHETVLADFLNHRHGVLTTNMQDFAVHCSLFTVHYCIYTGFASKAGT